MLYEVITTLFGDPGSQLAFPGPCRKISGGFGGADLFGPAGDGDLPGKFYPGKKEGDFMIDFNFQGLAAAVICKEDKTFPIKKLKQNGAQGWLAIAANSGQTHGVGFRQLFLTRITSYNVCYTKLLRSLSSEGKTDLRPELYRLAVDKNWTLTELHQDQANLEDVFRQLTSN